MPRKKHTRTEPLVQQITITDHEVDALYIDTQNTVISYQRIDKNLLGEEVQTVSRVNEQIVQSDFANNGDWNKFQGALEDLQEMLLAREEEQGEIGSGTINSLASGGPTIQKVNNGKGKT